MANVKVENKREIKNLIVWDVSEEKEVRAKPSFLGFAVLSRDRYHRMHLSQFKHYTFGDTTLKAVGIVPSTDDWDFHDKNAFPRSFTKLKHDPSYLCCINKENILMDENSDNDDEDDPNDDDGDDSEDNDEDDYF